MTYNFKQIEQKWQKKWESKKIFQVKEGKKKKYYVLDMFPYPSGSGLHMGHAFVFSLGDIHARLKRMQGFNVLYPIGYDALGLPAENAAIKVGEHPENYNKKTTKNFMKQQKAMGWSYDWSRLIRTDDPSYYKWDQWIFLKMFEKGLAYKKESAVNWCKTCNTVLANEQVHNGKCWRHEDTEVEVKHLEQWFFGITEYADELISGLDKLNWPERAKLMQRNWIGKSSGTEIKFGIGDENWNIFTTRPDTLFGVTFLVISAQHPRLMEIVTNKQKKDIEKFLKKLKSVSEKELESMSKEGVFTGSYAINPLTNEKVPVYAGNFVLADYGCGMVMAVPAHDKRDFEFAKKYGIEIKEVIQPAGYELKEEKISRAYVGEGKLTNSGEFNGLDNNEAKEKITKYLSQKKLGKKVVQFRLRDWLISRQRYWGTPIPIVYCDKCGVVPVPEKDLPIELPKKVKFGKGNPLLTVESWIKTKCPKCKGSARRETDTMDTFVNSSWYFLRYCDSKNNKNIFDKKKVDYWCPINQYIGGPEHITMHLIYARFYTKFLRDIGLVKFDEPALRYFTQGIVKASDGEKMSKSKGNVVEPLEIINKYGADVLRFYLISSSSPDKDFSWNDKEIQGSLRFILSLYEFGKGFKPRRLGKLGESKLNRIIKDVGEDLENFKYNLAVIKLRELFEVLKEGCDKKSFEIFLKLLSPICPHIAEELWSKIGGKGFISLAKWPKYDEKKIDENLEKQEQFVKKIGEDINHIKEIVKIKNPTAYVYAIPSDLPIIEENKEIISTMSGAIVIPYAVNDKNIHDPEGKAKKAKPGKPGIYME
jgi:leucyl-tRNA synthetase|tara:strand:+ start:589 stop:3042 length:2454 start_codon:yes stop_codon:yes gene_type:complete